MNDSNEAPHKEKTETETATKPTEEVLTADEVAELLRVTRKTVYKAFRAGEIPGGRRLGTALRFSRSRVLQWLADGQERAARSPKGAR
jgi:excisionase family DNA binding protein